MNLFQTVAFFSQLISHQGGTACERKFTVKTLCSGQTTTNQALANGDLRTNLGFILKLLDEVDIYCSYKNIFYGKSSGKRSPVSVYCGFAKATQSQIHNSAHGPTSIKVY